MSLADTAITCHPDAAPLKDSVLRLTGRQFQNTVYSLIRAGTASSDYANLAALYGTPVITTLLQSFPTEGSYDKGNSMVYDTQDQRLTTPLFQSQFSLALNLAQWLAANPTRLTFFVNYYAGSSACAGTVPNTGASQTCLDAFIKGFGLRALRRPVESANNPIDASTGTPTAANDLAFYEAVYNDAVNGGFDSLITAMLMSPDSLFLNHIKGTPAGSLIAITNYETAAKLSYYYTDNPPDDQLMAAAAAGFTGSGNSLSQQADRLFASDAARSRFTNFYSQWIRPSAIPALTVSSNSPALNLYILRLNAIQEMVDLTEYYTFGAANGSVSDIVSSDISFAKSADLAGIYGVNVWPGKNSDGSYDATKLVHFPPSNPRAGLFTRAGYAFSGARDNNLIIRGARIRKDYLCENLVPPAAFALSPDIPLQGPPSVRNIVVANTEQTGTSCVGCHKPSINPLGFALENYDAFGRYRQTEPIFNADGTLKESVPVDATSTPLASNGDATQVSDAIGLSHILGKNVEFNACFVRHYFRYSQSRLENDVADGCRLNKMLGTLVNNPAIGSIQSMVKSVATAPSFTTRNISP